MKNIIRLEELFIAILAIYLFSLLDYAWWWFLLLFFAPDLSFIAYAGGPRIGGIVYDLLHHRGLLIGLYLIGALASVGVLQLVSLPFLAHSSVDRVFGYGLKFLDSPRHTHLGMVGKEPKQKATDADI